MSYKVSRYKKYWCLADPNDELTCKMFFGHQLRHDLEAGQLPPGSVWRMSGTVFEVWGEEGEEQEMLPVGKNRLRLLPSRYPVLKYYLECDNYGAT